MKWIRTDFPNMFFAKHGTHTYKITSRGHCYVLWCHRSRLEREQLYRGTVNACKLAAIKHVQAQSYVDSLMRRYAKI